MCMCCLALNSIRACSFAFNSHHLLLMHTNTVTATLHLTGVDLLALTAYGKLLAQAPAVVVQGDSPENGIKLSVARKCLISSS